MKCTDVRQQLSAYYDGELDTPANEAVKQHLAECEQCASELASFASLTEEFARSPKLEAPASIWTNLSQRLDASSTKGASLVEGESLAPLIQTSSLLAPTQRNGWLGLRHFAVAAAVLILLGLGVIAARHSRDSDTGPMAAVHDHEHEHSAEFAMTMDHYLKTLPNDPDAAERFLLSKYEGTTVPAESAVQLVGYRPAVAGGLPDGYSLASTSVLKMPCCTCVKAVCKRSDGSTLVLFEHDDEKTEWFGDRKTSQTVCGDTECCLVDLDSSIAATWRRGSRSVTAVGVRNQAELGELIDWLEKT
ncbi:anti-sigma factor family protein [Novipirellula artificiosorum]|uniref:Putative zinc-finger domain-containing protein n=1 Tax=Novipirellula artificiosorum TaxID=2528016 RepID=A0A5C6DCB2_9BACT|nr:zf-HC2 domain-containing protein [Novipirellula artificiosorum]TWU34873.1 hypothetical protein Poly41_40160 [Novipirellula artificiosorum]